MALMNSPIFSFPLLLVIYSLSSINANECGQVAIIQGAILNGKQTLRGEWPFLAALFNLEKSKFFCGSTVISKKNILTAAHCVQQKFSITKLLPEEVVVFLGRHNLQLRAERGSVQRYVDEIIVHPDWKVHSNDKYDADLAIFTLSQTVDFTRYIRPICLPGDDDDEHFPGVEGSIVGWGVSEFTEGNHENIPRHAVSTALNDSYCYTSNYLLASLSSLRTFCGSGERGTVNAGDSGGGYFVRSGLSWVQYGVISAVAADETGKVSINATAIYTKVKPFKSWIEKVVRLTGSEVLTLGDKRKTSIVLDCEYSRNEFSLRYTCFTYTNFDENTEVVSANLLNRNGQSLEDILDIRFQSKNYTSLPDGIGNVFKNLDVIVASFSKLKLIKRSNFKNMPHLTLLDFEHTLIETFDENVLWDLPNLIDFYIINSKLKSFHKNTFAKNFQLKVVHAEHNELEFIHKDLFKSNLLIHTIFLENNKLMVIAIDIMTLPNLKFLTLTDNVCIDNYFNNTTGKVEIEMKNEFQTLLTNQCSPL